MRSKLETWPARQACTKPLLSQLWFLYFSLRLQKLALEKGN